MEFGLDLYSLGIISFGLALGAFVKGLTGMGLPLVAVPFMAGFLGAEHAIVVMQIPGLVSNVWLVWQHRGEAKATPLRYDMIIPASLMTVVGVWFLDTADDNITILLLAVAVALLALMVNGFQVDEPDRRNLGALVSMLPAAVSGGWILARLAPSMDGPAPAG